MLFLWYPKCTTCQKAKAFLDERGVSYEARILSWKIPRRRSCGAGGRRAECP